MIDIEYGTKHALLRVEPEYGRPVTFEVVERDIDVSTGRWQNVQTRFVVQLKGHDSGRGFSHHCSFELAAQRALGRALRYHRAYSVPRKVAVS